MADDRPTDDLPSDLQSRIAAARAADAARTGGSVGKPEKGYAQGSKVLAMLLGSLIGGGVLGYAIDVWFGTSPWGLLIVLTLAVIGAFMNIIKMSKDPAR